MCKHRQAMNDLFQSIQLARNRGDSAPIPPAVRSEAEISRSLSRAAASRRRADMKKQDEDDIPNPDLDRLRTEDLTEPPVSEPPR